MRTFIVDCWNGVMDYRFNPLKHIPDLQVRHMMLQVLAWLWCIAKHYTFCFMGCIWYNSCITFYFNTCNSGYGCNI